MNTIALQQRATMRINTIPIVMFLVTLISLCPSAPAQLPSGPFPSGLGVNDHNIHETTAALQQMYSIGIRYLRIDLTWSNVEEAKGEYDFSGYDPLVTNAAQAGVKMLFILDYTNPLYDSGYSPDDTTGINAFVAYALAAVKHYQGKGVVWEIYNEPTEFWSTSGTTYTHWADANDVAPLYYNLATATAAAIKSAYPGEIVIGPADASFDSLLQPNGDNSYQFMDILLQDGLGNQLDAISVHPYRETNPETAEVDYDWLHGQIADNTTSHPPIVDSEWGYTSCYFDSNVGCVTAGEGGSLTYTQSEIQKADYVVRSILTDVSSLVPIPIHIIYDWMDDGTDQGNPQDNYGLVQYYSASNPTIQPLPAYYAVQTLTSQLQGYTFVQRILTNDDTDYILQFSNGTDSRYVCWNSSGNNNSVNVPIGSNVGISVISYDGNASGAVTIQRVTSGASGYSCAEQAYPQYIALTPPLLASRTTLSSSPSGSVTAGQSVTITATVDGQSDSTSPTGSVDFSIGSTSLGSAQLSNGIATLAVTTLPVGDDTVTATYSGDNVYSRSSGTIQITVDQVPASFTLGASPASLTLKPGGQGTVTLTVTPQNGFNSAVSFACSGLPSGALCAFNPGTITPSGAAATTTLTITGEALALNGTLSPFLQGAFMTPLLWLVGWKRRRSFQVLLLCAFVAAGLSLLSGCSGGSGGSSGGVTPAISTITVSATSGSIQQTATISLTVD